MAKKAEVEKNDFDENNPEDKKNKKEKNTKGKGKKKRKKLPLILFFLVLAGVITVFALNLFNLRNKYIYPLVKNIPIVGNLLHKDTADANAGLSKEQLMQKVSELESSIEKSAKESEELKARFDDRGKEIEKLQKYKNEIDKFNAEKAEFDKAVANKDTKSFVQFYKDIYPENAEKLYQETIGTIQSDKELKKYTSNFNEMDPAASSQILEKMMGSDINLVVKILKNVDTKTSAAILGAMKPDNAAIIVKKMNPSTTSG